MVDKKLFKSGDQKQHAQREQIICETFASGLKHKNIVQVYDVLTENDYIYVIMEYVEGGELFDKIKQSKGLAEPTARRWFRELIEAVEYIHEVSLTFSLYLHKLYLYILLAQYCSQRLKA